MELHKAIKQIVDQFGKDVLTEDRFVNILADMYPDRDNPAVFSIIRTLVKEGYSSDLLLCNKDNVQSFISKSALVLNHKNGYDKNLVESLLNSLAVGSKITNLPSPIVPTPKKQRKHVNNKPQASNQKPVKSPPSSHGLLILFWWALSFFGLFIAPVVYLLAITGLWWPSATLILILVIQAVIFTISYQKLVKFKPLPVIGGSFSAIILCAVIFYAFAPFYAESDSTKEVIYFMEIPYQHEMAFPIVTLVLSVYYFGFVNIGGRIAGYDLTLIVEYFIDKYASGKCMDKLLNNKHFMKGFILSGLFILMIGVFVMNWPKIDSWKIDIRNSILRNGRSEVDKVLSFAGFILGSDFDSCLIMAKSSPDFKYQNMYFSKQEIELNDNAFVTPDSSITVKTKWYNDSVDFDLHFFDGKLLALEIETLQFDTDSILALFTSKYGRPEYKKIRNGERYFKSEFYNKSWTWTFKNGAIRFDKGIIIYYDRRLETIADLIKEKENQKKQEIEKQIQFEEQEELNKQRIKDSLDNLQKQKEERNKEMERKRAIEQI